MAAKRTRRMGAVAIALLATVSLGLTSCTEGSVFGGDDEVNSVDASLAGAIDDSVAQAMQLSRSDAAVVGVWTANGSYVHGYGEGITASSPIRAGQASQPVMCAALLSLAEAGELKLGREVSKDLTRQLDLDGITYAELCDASSGLADFRVGLFDQFANNPTRPWSDRELLAYSLAHSPMFEPGSKQSPSDTGALVLARALKQVTKQSAAEMLKERVFSQAGMPNTSYPTDLLSASELPGNGMSGLTFPMANNVPVCTAPGETEGTTVALEPTAVPSISPSMLGGAGATITTVTDLKNFYEHYVKGGFGAESAKLITEPWQAPVVEGEEPAAAPTEPVPPTKASWTFGLEKVGPLYGKGGAITGTITAAYHDPETGFSVVVALNNSSAGPDFARDLAFQLAALGGEQVEWTAEDRAASLAERAICQPAAEPAEAAAAE